MAGDHRDERIAVVESGFPITNQTGRLIADLRRQACAQCEKVVPVEVVEPISGHRQRWGRPLFPEQSHRLVLDAAAAAGDAEESFDPGAILGYDDFVKQLANQVVGVASDQRSGGACRVDHGGFSIEFEQNVGPAKGQGGETVTFRPHCRERRFQRVDRGSYGRHGCDFRFPLRVVFQLFVECHIRGEMRKFS